MVTTIFYPARGAVGPDPVADAPADRSDGPYPLVVFADGLGGSPAAYQGLLAEWAAAGYVVVVPRSRRRTSRSRRVGSIPVTLRNQPADVTAVLTGTLEAADRDDGPLAGMVAPDDVGVAGHSLGGITTLGVAAQQLLSGRPG